jgi:hypothetical protein
MAYAPIELSIAIHYHTTSRDDYPGVSEGYAPQMDCVKRMIDAGLLEATPDGSADFGATDGLRVYIDALLAVPYPVKEWVMPKDRDP